MNRNWTKPLLLFVPCLMLTTAGCAQITSLFDIAAGASASLLCSNVFISERTVESVLEQEACLDCRMPGVGALADQFLTCDVDSLEKSVTCDLFYVKRKSIFREHLGCTLLYGRSDGEIAASEAEVRAQDSSGLIPFPPGQESLPWPTGDVLSGDIPPEVDLVQLESVLDEAFSEPDPGNLRRTRGVVVVYDGQLVKERYAEDEGFSTHTPHYGWSMTKSVTSALIGIRMDQLVGLDIYDPAPVAEWGDPLDPRHAITTDQLLRMSSGLVFDEDYGSPFSDVPMILYGNILDRPAYAANKPLLADPDTLWQYSSGTSAILSGIIRSTFPTLAEYFAFPRRELFDRIGMRSAFIEVDQIGNFLGGSHMWATPRDWARFGLLCLQDGVWEGERILPEGWVEYVTTPTPTHPNDSYGAQFWLNVGQNNYPSLPEDLFACEGHDRQRVTVIPSRNLVIVRVGYTLSSSAWDHEAFVYNIMDAIGETP